MIRLPGLPGLPLPVSAAEAVADQPWLPAALGVVSAVVVAWMGYRQASRVAREAREAAAAEAREAATTEARRIDGEAYERAKGWYDTDRSQQQQQIAQLRKDVAEERAESSRLRARVTELEDEVARLRRRLILAGIQDGQT